MYADIIVDISVDELDKTFQYSVPEGLKDRVKPGTKVTIPFGKSRTLTGYCIGLSNKPKIEEDRIKPILDVNDKDIAIEDKMIALAVWMKENFGSTLNEALKCVLPVKKKVREVVKKTICLKIPVVEAKNALAEAIRKKQKARERLLLELVEEGSGGLDYALVTKKLNISATTINTLERDGIINVVQETVYRQPNMSSDEKGIFKPELNEEQSNAANGIISDLRAGKREDYLIHGITGSGKTEVYMAVIDEVISQGKQVIMLIPEIALTFQTVKRFYRRFGDKISVMNSKLSFGERFDQYQMAKNGQTQIVIGPRSALFTPFQNLGLIIIDEEHEGSYKSEQSPKYQTRDVAFYRGRTEGASVILGSATPSLEAYSAAVAGRIKLYELNKRAGDAIPPKVDIVDLREELREGNRSMFSRRLHELIEDRLKKHEQIMLFLNRRGHSGFVNCRSCGYVIKCPHCDVSLTYHNNGDMVCHYCGHRETAATKCPKCESKYIRPFNFGTQKVEEQLKKEFPGAGVLRMDADTTKQKESYDELLSAFANQEADILVGTQMIVKGHDFHNVTLVGILLADMSLYSQDYRAGERTFDLLAQAAGRAGRGSEHGEVVIQTYNPEHYSIVCAAENNYKAFYDEEIAFRTLMNYPPSWSMLKVLMISENEKKLEDFANRINTLASEYVDLNFQNVSVFGPSKAPIYKINDVYRYLIFVKASNYEELVKTKDYLVEWEAVNRSIEINTQYDFN